MKIPSNSIGAVPIGDLMLTEAEQNRLILEHRERVEPIAAKYRGRKGVPFEDLVSEGVLGLVFAARNWCGLSQFATYATATIDGYIKNFINRWEVMDQLDEVSEEDEHRIIEWQVWGIFPAEGWTSLPATMAEIDMDFSVLADHEALPAAMLSLARDERKVIDARYNSAPQARVEQIARDRKRSYHETVCTLFSAVKKLGETIQRVERNRRYPLGDTRALPRQARPMTAPAALRVVR
jgi:RNA polymerase sigma factor (sigma-70 family)